MVTSEPQKNQAKNLVFRSLSPKVIPTCPARRGIGLLLNWNQLLCFGTQVRLNRKPQI